MKVKKQKKHKHKKLVVVYRKVSSKDTPPAPQKVKSLKNEDVASSILSEKLLFAWINPFS